MVIYIIVNRLLKFNSSLGPHLSDAHATLCLMAQREHSDDLVMHSFPALIFFERFIKVAQSMLQTLELLEAEIRLVSN